MNYLGLKIETLDVSTTAAIISIAAVVFTKESGITDSFHINISSDQKSYGRTVSNDTVKFIKGLPDDIKKQISSDRVDLPYALNALSHFIKSKNVKLYPCSFNSLFDIAILKSAYETCEIDLGFNVFNVIDIRTIYTLTKTINNYKMVHNPLTDITGICNEFINLI